MNFSEQGASTHEINLTPLIDVVFILLIFFMVTTTFERQSFLRINLPQADVRPETVTKLPNEIVIDDRGFFYLKGRKVLNTRAATLLAGVRQMRWFDKDQAITIRADARAPHQSVVTALQVLTRMGYRKISISTTPAR